MATCFRKFAHWYLVLVGETRSEWLVYQNQIYGVHFEIDNKSCKCATVCERLARWRAINRRKSLRNQTKVMILVTILLFGHRTSLFPYKFDCTVCYCLLHYYYSDLHRTLLGRINLAPKAYEGTRRRRRILLLLLHFESGIYLELGYRRRSIWLI